LEHLESLTIEATGHPPLEVREARVEHVIEARQPRRVYASVEGVLELIAHRSGALRVGIREHNTGRYVRCTLPEKEWLGRLRDLSLFSRRVVVDGRVAYDEEGRPLSITDVTDITPRRAGKPIREFKGAVPDLTGGLPTEEFIARIRGDE
jgi:hypothetical protein